MTVEGSSYPPCNVYEIGQFVNPEVGPNVCFFFVLAFARMLKVMRQVHLLSDTTNYCVIVHKYDLRISSMQRTPAVINLV